jgi:hypothetical protein
VILEHVPIEQFGVIVAELEENEPRTLKPSLEVDGAAKEREKEHPVLIRMLLTDPSDWKVVGL